MKRQGMYRMNLAATTTLTLCLLLAWAIGASHATAPWSLSGSLVEPCRCDIPCPHVTTPTLETFCQGFDVFHVVEGSYGDVSLDNLNFAVAGDFPAGSVDEPDWVIATYVSEEASPDQVEAVQNIVDELFGFMVAKDLGIKSVPIVFKMSGDTYQVSIPNILELESTLLPDMPSVPGYFGTPFDQAQAVVHTYKDHDIEWDWSGQNSWHSELLLQGGGSPTAVAPQGKLALTWGKIKQR